MKKYACQYNIIRFAPFVETEEFANIGIAIYCPSTGKFEYRLAPTRFGRVTQFFEDLDAELYKSVIQRLKNELNALKDILEENPNSKMGMALFAETMRNKGSVIHFSDVRIVLTENLEEKANTLYGYYVGRSFNTKKYREQVMVSNVKKSLKQFSLDKFYKQVKLNDGLTDVTLPLVNIDERVISAIKPIAFDQAIPAKIVEHADLWQMRLDRLAQSGTIKADDLLIALEMPVIRDKKILNYITQFEKKLTKIGVNTVDYNDTTKIVEFARSRTPDNSQTTTH